MSKRLYLFGAVSLLALNIAAAELSAQTVALEQPVVTELPEETVREARQSERALTRDEKKELQIAMQWYGFYKARIDGDYGPATRRAMTAWQEANNYETTGVLTTRQRAALLAAYNDIIETLDMAQLSDNVAGVQLTAPMGMVQFDRYDAPFAHYAEKNASGVRMSLISQQGDRRRMNGLFEILQTLEEIPAESERERSSRGFTISGLGVDRNARVTVRLSGDHIYGYMLTWPKEQDQLVGFATKTMDETLTSIGEALPVEALDDPAAQNPDLFAGFQIRKPLYAVSGFYVDGDGRVLTTSRIAEECARVTFERDHVAEVAYVDAENGFALLKPEDTLRPLASAQFSQEPVAPRARVAVAGYPYEGILGSASLTRGEFGASEGLAGEETLYRLNITTQAGDIGGAVFDEAGAVIGLLKETEAGTQQLPESVQFAANAEVLMRALGGQGVRVGRHSQTAALDPVDLAAKAKDISVLVQCWGP